MSTIPNHKFRVPLQETDHAGVMFFTHLFVHAHDAYAEMMQVLGFPLHQIIENGEYHIPLIHAAADYLAPLRHGQPVEITIGIEATGNSSFSLVYDFSSENVTYATVITRHVVIDPDTRNAIPLPDELRQQLVALNTSQHFDRDEPPS